MWLLRWNSSLYTRPHVWQAKETAVVSILLYWCTTWTLTKRLKKKLDGNYTRMLRAILNKYWRQHPTRHQLYGHLPPITKAIQVRRTRHAGHCWRSRDELISDVLLWTPTYGRAKAGRPARTYIQQLCEDTECSPEDLPEAMNDRGKWRERVRDIRAISTWWWWWWWWWLYGNMSQNWWFHDWLIDWFYMWIQLGFFYAKRLGNRVHCTFISTYMVLLSLKNFLFCAGSFFVQGPFLYTVFFCTRSFFAHGPFLHTVFLCTRSFQIRIIFKHIYLNRRWDPNRYYHSGLEWIWK